MKQKRTIDADEFMEEFSARCGGKCEELCRPEENLCCDAVALIMRLLKRQEASTKGVSNE